MINFTEAIADYTKVIEINPNLAEAYCKRGDAYRNQRKLSQTLSNFLKVKTNSNDAIQDDQYQAAIADYTKAIEINPSFAAAYHNRGDAYFMIKEYDKAWADVHKAEGLGLAIDPEFLNALKKLSGRDK
jgi:tetratricopeptide (TPR) repeat protein